MNKRIIKGPPISIKNCKHCDSEFEGKPSTKIFCCSECRDAHHNNIKKEVQQNLQQLKLKTELKQEEINLREAHSQSDEAKRKKAEIQIHFQGLDIPDEGLVVDTSYFNKINFDPSLYDKKIELKYHPGYYLLEYGDFGVFWVEAYKFLLTNKLNYLSWI